MEKNLMTIVADTNKLTEQLIEAHGELSPELEAQLDTVNLELGLKIDGYKHVIDRVDIEQTYWKEKSQLYSKIAKGCANIKNRLKDSIKLGMLGLKKDEVIGIETRFKLSKIKPKLHIDEENLSPEYCKQRIIIEPDLERIREALEKGEKVAGAYLEDNYSLRNYVNRSVK